MTFFNRYGITRVDGKPEIHTLGTQQQRSTSILPNPHRFFQISDQ
jgi:hypothetical protein